MNGNTETSLRFDEEDLRLFSAASGDRNPLHLSASYASRTAYGQQVVFGALGALACLGSVELSDGQRIARLNADFHRPMFLGVDYQIKATKQSGSTIVRLFDGTVPMLTLAANFKTADERQNHAVPIGPVFERSEAAEWREAGFRPGLSVDGRWRADPALLAELCRRWHVDAGRFAAEALLWGSYLAGMVLPGRSALFFRFSLDFEATSPSADPLTYRATIQSMNPRIAQLRMEVTLNSERTQVASGQFLSFVRPELAAAASDSMAGIPVSDALRGKVGLVIGASRGLGAATASVLALQGAEVIAASRSLAADFASGLPSEAAARITIAQGDATSMDWLAELRNQIRASHGRLDYLICNAFPAIPALRLEPNAFSRIQAYLTQAVNLVLGPLCVFLELLNESGGCAVVVSSVAVQQPVREWPHYIAAKNAIEALARVAPLQHPRTSSLIVRPERLLTEMTNTPMGRQNALPPSRMAAEIVARLRNPPPAGTTEVMLQADKISESPATGV